MNPNSVVLSFIHVPDIHGFLTHISKYWQFGPKNPVGHKHLYVLGVITHLPLFLQGLSQQGSKLGLHCGPKSTVLIFIILNSFFLSLFYFES